MKVVGLITEYNPFHNGHLYHLNKAKETARADFTIAVMSGNFVQRGNPAFVDKWTRTKMALYAGIDLVIELPVVYATASAEFFAYGAVQLLHKMGIVDSICFGSEEGDLDFLNIIANILRNEPNEFKKNLKEELSKGLGFATSRNNALFTYLSDGENTTISKQKIQQTLSSPNNILGIEYLKALQTLGSSIIPYTIKRQGAGYHSTNINSTIASATAIRKFINKKDYHAIKHVIPENSYTVLIEAINHGHGPVLLDDFSSILNYLLATLTPEKITEYMEISEGLENRIIRGRYNNFFITDMIQEIGTKRYTNTRIRRALLHILLQIKRENFYTYHLAGGPQYARILGFKKESSELLSALKLKSQLPIVSNVTAAYKEFTGLQKLMLDKEIYTTDIYALGFPDTKLRNPGYEFTKPIVIL